MDTETYVKLTDYMQAVSPGVLNHLVNKSYIPKAATVRDPDGTISLERPDVPLDITYEYIVNSSLEIILSELSNLGILFHCSMDELLGTFYDANFLITMRKLFDNVELRKVFSISSDVKNKFMESVTLQEDQTRLVVTHLRILTDIDSSLHEAYEFMSDKMYNKLDYPDRIELLSDVSTGVGVDDVFDSEEMDKLIAYIAKTGEAMTRVINAASEVDESKQLNYEFLWKKQGKFNFFLTYPQNINKGIYWYKYLIEGEEGGFGTLADEVNEEYRRSSDNCVEYYLQKPPDTIKAENLLLLFGGLIDPHNFKDKPSLLAAMDTICTQLNDRHDIAPGGIKLLKDTIEVVDLPL